jgi:hypothetical protein
MASTAGRAAVNAEPKAGRTAARVAATAFCLLLLAVLLLPLLELKMPLASQLQAGLSLLLEWQLQLAELIFQQILLLLLAELLLSLLIGCNYCLFGCWCCCCCWDSMLLSSFLPPTGIVPVFMLFLPPWLAGCLLCYPASSAGCLLCYPASSPRNIGTREINALSASVRFQNQSGPGTCSIALLKLHQEAHISQTKSGKQQGRVPTLCV